MMRFRKNRAESAVATVPPAVGTGSSVTDTEATTVTVTIERDKPQSKVQVVIRDERADLREHRELPDVHPTDREFFQKFYRGKPEQKYDVWIRKRFPFWRPA